MNDRQHICAYMRFLDLYISVDYSWDRHQKYQRAAILTKCNAIHYSFTFAIILPYSTFHLDYMYIYSFLGEEAQTKKFGSVNLFTAGRSCRLPSLLSCYTNFSTRRCIIVTRVDLVSLTHQSTIAGQHTGTNHELCNCQF